MFILVLSSLSVFTLAHVGDGWTEFAEVLLSGAFKSDWYCVSPAQLGQVSQCKAWPQRTEEPLGVYLHVSLKILRGPLSNKFGPTLKGSRESQE